MVCWIYAWFLLLINLDSTSNALSWTTYPSKNGDEYVCEGDTALLKWNFTTEERVLAVQWIKEPEGWTIAVLAFGKFIANEGYSKRVSRYSVSQYNAAIQISNFNENDKGDYTCSVESNTRYSQGGTVKFVKIPKNSLIINSDKCEQTTCKSAPPYVNETLAMYSSTNGSHQLISSGIDLVTMDTCDITSFRCCMKGPEKCNTSAFCVNETINESPKDDEIEIDDSLSGGAIAGIVISVLFSGFVLVVCIVLFRRKRNQRKDKQAAEQPYRLPD